MRWMYLCFSTHLHLLFFISIAGIPAKPVNVHIAGTDVIIGTTKASALLDNGFTFKRQKCRQ